MSNRIAILIFAGLLMSSCGGSKKTVQTPVSPSWVQARPTIQLYYVGIGSARKSADANGYMQSAKQNSKRYLY